MTAVKPAHKAAQPTRSFGFICGRAMKKITKSSKTTQAATKTQTPQLRERHDEIERHLRAGHRPDRRDDEDEVLVVGVAIERNPRVESLEPAIGWLPASAPWRGIIPERRDVAQAAVGVAGLGLDDGFGASAA